MTRSIAYARKLRSREKAKKRMLLGQRDGNTITNRRLLNDSSLRKQSYYVDSPVSSSLEDRREFYPARSRRPFLTTRGMVSNFSPWIVDVARVAFESPEKVMVCVRRKMRREVLHALRITGKSGTGKRRRTPASNIHC